MRRIFHTVCAQMKFTYENSRLTYICEDKA